MENMLQIFDAPNLGTIRVLVLNGEPLFVANDACDILGYADPFGALKKHVPDKYKQVINAKKLQQMASQSKTVDSTVFDFTGDETILLEFDSPRGLTFVTEAGLYRLILRSNMPKAEEFTDYVCEVILPSIRKTGSFTLPNSQKDSKEITRFERGIELRKLASHTRNPEIREQIIAQAAVLLANA